MAARVAAPPPPAGGGGGGAFGGVIGVRTTPGPSCSTTSTAANPPSGGRSVAGSTFSCLDDVVDHDVRRPVYRLMAGLRADRPARGDRGGSDRRRRDGSRGRSAVVVPRVSVGAMPEGVVARVARGGRPARRAPTAVTSLEPRVQGCVTEPRGCKARRSRRRSAALIPSSRTRTTF